ncbi:MAG: mechanosensitive ion channel family protein [SAR324 cluster bacterium]|nr:mechanosensitive ion channel family protein [SAR324 cluster bacterium]
MDPENYLFTLVPALRGLGVITAFAWFMILLVKNGESAYLETERSGEAAVDRATVNAFAKLLRISIFITAGLVALQNIGFSISGVLAFGGIGGLAVGLAAKDLLANFFGTLMLFLDRPFVVGDWIRSPDKEIEGTVEHISWRLTRIRTFDKRPLYVPNAIFSIIAVENPSRMTHRRIYETLGIRYEDASKMEAITAAVEEMLRSHPGIDSSQTLMVNFTSYASSSLDFFIYTFTKTTDWAQFHKVKQDVLLRVNAIIADHGAEIAFPTSTLHLSEGSNAAAPFSANRQSE